MRTFKEGDAVVSVDSGALGIVYRDEQPGDMGVSVRWPHNQDKIDEVTNTPPSNLRLVAPASRDAYTNLQRLTEAMGRHLQKVEGQEAKMAQASDEALAALKDKLSGNLPTGVATMARRRGIVDRILSEILTQKAMENLLSDNPLDASQNTEKWKFLEAGLILLKQRNLLVRPAMTFPTEPFTVIDAWFHDTPDDAPVRLVLLGRYWYDEDQEHWDMEKAEYFRIAKVGDSDG